MLTRPPRAASTASLHGARFLVELGRTCQCRMIGRFCSSESKLARAGVIETDPGDGDKCRKRQRIKAQPWQHFCQPTELVFCPCAASSTFVSNFRQPEPSDADTLSGCSPGRYDTASTAAAARSPPRCGTRSSYRGSGSITCAIIVRRLAFTKGRIPVLQMNYRARSQRQRNGRNSGQS
jgi:hypothetical protein